VIEASSDVEQDETAIEQSGQASSGASPSTSRLPGNREAGARPLRDIPAEAVMGQTTTTMHNLAALAEAAAAVATHDPHITLATSELAEASLATSTVLTANTLQTSHWFPDYELMGLSQGASGVENPYPRREWYSSETKGNGAQHTTRDITHTVQLHTQPHMTSHVENTTCTHPHTPAHTHTH